MSTKKSLGLFGASTVMALGTGYAIHEYARASSGYQVAYDCGFNQKAVTPQICSDVDASVDYDNRLHYVYEIYGAITWGGAVATSGLLLSSYRIFDESDPPIVSSSPRPPLAPPRPEVLPEGPEVPPEGPFDQNARPE